MGILQRILESKRAELPALRARKLPPPPVRPRLELEDTAASGHAGLKLIGEIKLKSPSAGPLSRVLSVKERAAAYQEAGVFLISVLCDGPFFDGGYEHLRQARSGCSVPLLCKEFILDECQLDAAASFGASAALLIVRCLTPERLGVLIEEAEARALRPLVEVFSDEEARIALDAGATFVGVNARDLDTLHMDSERAGRVLTGLPDAIFAAHLSGVRTPADVRRVAKSRADAALLGEVLMRQDDPRELLRSLSDATIQLGS